MTGRSFPLDRFVTAFLLFTASLLSQTGDAWRVLFPSGPMAEEIATTHEFTEGPVWIAARGAFIFSDIPRSSIYQWSAGRFSIFLTNTHGANGNTLAADGSIISCEHGSRSVTRTGTDVVTIAERYDGKQFNSPNDVVIGVDDALYFTDPDYGLQGRTHEIDGNGVYRVDAGGRVSLLTMSLKRPNGICFSPDGRSLYIADADPSVHAVYRFDMNGTAIENGKLWYTVDRGIPDGIRCDGAGRLWIAAGDGIHVVTDGVLIGRIPLKRQPTNLCFGGTDGRTIFITARSSVYIVSAAIDLMKRE